MQQQNKEDKLNSISMHEFLDFLKLTCQVHQSVTTKDESPRSEDVLDYNKLAKNDLVNSLLIAKRNTSLSPKTAEIENNGGVACTPGASSTSPFDRKGMCPTISDPEYPTEGSFTFFLSYFNKTSKRGVVCLFV